jgi:hypothetical protein
MIKRVQAALRKTQKQEVRNRMFLDTFS